MSATLPEQYHTRTTIKSISSVQRGSDSMAVSGAAPSPAVVSPLPS